MNEYKLEVDGKELDTFAELGISLNYQLEDIIDITKRKTSYSKTIELPGTPINNSYFKDIYDVNVDTLYYNPSVSAVPATVRVGDNAVFTGNLQLINITIVNGEIVYEVVISGSLGTILNEISDYSLGQLDLSEYNHTRNQATISGSWDYNIYKNGTLTELNNGGEGYVYPYIINAFNQGQSANELLIYNQFPAVYMKTIMDKIFEFAGYTYSSDFFNSEYFSKLIMPYTGDEIQLDEEELSNRTTTVGANGNSIESIQNPIATGYRAMSPYQIDQGAGWYKNYNSSWFIPFNLESGSVGSVDFQDPQGQWQQINGWQSQQNGFYDFKMDVKLFFKYWASGFSGQFRYNDTDTLKYYYRVRKVSTGGATTILYQSTFPYEVAPSDDAWHNSPWYDLETPLTMAATLNGVWMNVGERFVIEFGVNFPSMNWNFKNSIQNDSIVKMRPVVKESYDGNASYIKVSPAGNTSMGNETINMNYILPDIKMKDLFLNIVKMFNLIVSDNPNKDRDLIIEPRDEFFTSREKVVDWNDIIDNSSDKIISPMSEVDARTYLFTYKKDEDFFNEEYTNETKEVYGNLKIDIDNDFSISTKKLELLFSPTPDASQFIGEKVAPFFAESKTPGQFTPKKVKPRILFYSGKIRVPTTGGSSYIYLKDYPNQPIGSSIASLYYPYVGMWDHPTAPTADLAFGRTQKIYWDTDVVPYNNLYETFHRSTLENIIDSGAKILEATFYLTPKDMAEFDFRNIVFLDGQYWRVLKIKDYNPAGSDSLTKVKLYKLVNYDSYGNATNEIPVSNKPCPIDIVAFINGKHGPYYGSLSGGKLTAECCKAIGGNYKKGICWVRRTKPGGIGNPKPHKDIRPILYPMGGSDVVPTSNPEGPYVLKTNNNTINSASTNVKGQNNFIGTEVENITVIGDGNTVINGVTNTIVIGDNITATESGAIFLANSIIHSDGSVTSVGLKVIDGGGDVVFPYTKTNQVDVIDGTVDSVRNPNGTVSNRVIIDAQSTDGDVPST